MATETSLENLVRANQVDMSKNTSGNDPVVSSGSYTQDPTTQARQYSAEPSVQLLQRGFIIGSEDGGPIDVTEVVDEVDSLSELTTLFKESGGLYYGKKVYVKDKKSFYYYSHMGLSGSETDDDWKIIN